MWKKVRDRKQKKLEKEINKLRGEIAGSPLQIMVNQIQCFEIHKAEFYLPLPLQDYQIADIKTGKIYE